MNRENAPLLPSQITQGVKRRLLDDDDADERPETKKQRLPYDASFVLSDQQQTVIDAVEDGKSVFFTGSAGTGKSKLIQFLVDQNKHDKHTFITASTGLAGCNIGGVTLHSFAGVGLGEGSVDWLVSKIMRNKEAKQRWIDCRRLIIDEISMISGELFDKIESVARLVRRVNEPFGGIQLVICGDFLQLPPVKATKFAFQADSWKSCIKVQVQLTKVFRQNDSAFVDILADMRIGRCTSDTLARLDKCKETKFAKSWDDDLLLPTKLYPHRNSATEENETELAKLQGEPHTYRAKDTGDEYYFRQLSQGQAPDTLILKAGAQVILLANLDTKNGLCNGARGVVIEFKKSTDAIHGDRYFPAVEFENGMLMLVTPHKWEIVLGGRVRAARSQVPLNLAWALTVHKSQGMTIERAEMSLANCFEYGQVYVAISRMRSLDGLKLNSFDPAAVRANPVVVEFYRSFMSTL